MGLKIFTIILILFVAEITFLSTKEPKKLSSFKKDINYSTIEFTKIKGITITKKGITEKITASKVLKFKTHDELYNISASFQENNISHTLQAKKATYKNGYLTLSEDVHYENNQSLQIKSQELEYNTKTKIATSPGAFTMYSDKGVAHGDTFVYDIKTNRLKGQKLRYSFEVDEK